MGSKAVKSVGDLAGNVVKKALDVFGINSPSKVFHKMGAAGVAQGFINGVNSMASNVHDAVVGMITVPASRMQTAFRTQQQTATNAAASAARQAGQLWASSQAVGAAPAGGFTVPVTINVAGSIQAERDFAKTMSLAIRDQIRQIGRQNGGNTGLTGIK
jgi:septal ring-binding cell division protein DamX